MVSTAPVNAHRQYKRGRILDRLQVQLDPATMRRIKRLALVSGRSWSGIAAATIATALPQLEREHAAALDALPAGAEDIPAA